MSHHEEEGARHGYDAELVAEELRKPTREEIVTTIVMAKYGVPTAYRSGETYKIADALLREYEIRERDELPKL